MNKDLANELIKSFKYFRSKDIPCSAATAFAIECVDNIEVEQAVKLLTNDYPPVTEEVINDIGVDSYVDNVIPPTPEPSEGKPLKEGKD